MQVNEIETDWDDIKRTKKAQPWFAPAENFYISTYFIWLKMLSFSQVLPQPENIELVSFYAIQMNILPFTYISLEECAFIYFQYGNILTKEAQPWFVPTGEIFHFVLSYLFKNGPISD